jgi:transcriptional regulator with XRE-family HTH domain
MQGSLPTRLRLLRAQQGLTLVEAAEKIGIGRDTLSELERGRRHPVMPTLSKIARGYGVQVEELLDLEEEVPQEALSEERALTGKAEAPPATPPSSETGLQSVESQALEALFSYVEQRIKMYEEVLKDPDNPPLSIVVSIVDLRLIAELLVEQGKLLAESMIATGRGRAAVTRLERVKQYIEELAELEKRARERFADKHGPLDKAGLQQSLARTGGQYVELFGEIPVGQHFNPFDITQPQQWPAATRQAAQDLWAKVQDARKRT